MPQQPELDNQQTGTENQTQNHDGQTPNQGGLWYESMSRRKLLKEGVILAGKATAIVVGGTAAVAGAKISADKIVPPENHSNDLGPTPKPDSTDSPEKENSGIEFGGNTHIHPFAEGEDNMTLDEAKRDVDKLVEAKQEWIRFNLINSSALTLKDDGSLEFTKGIEAYDELINYAKQKGLKIALVTNAPESLASLPTNEYADQAAAFYTQLALRYGDKIDTWQIFNEADSHHFRNYNGQYDFDQAYIDDLKKVVEASSEAIRAISKNAKITMNASLWGADKKAIRNRTERFFDALNGYLDFISLDPYPDVSDPNAALTIPQDIEHFYKRYDGKKDIVIAEIGVSELDIPDAQKRANILLSYISAIKSGNVQPKAVLIYEMRDENTNPDPREAEFGNEDTWNTITPLMQSEESEADQ